MDASADGCRPRSPTSPGGTPATWSPSPAARVTETEIARVLDNLLTRAEHGPDTAGRKIAARTRAALAAHWAPTPEPAAPEPAKPTAASRPDTAEAIPFGVFDADAEAERWI
jgi:putative transposase